MGTWMDAWFEFVNLQPRMEHQCKLAFDCRVQAVPNWLAEARIQVGDCKQFGFDDSVCRVYWVEWLSGVQSRLKRAFLRA